MHTAVDSEHVSEMEIVDTITRLIFGEAVDLAPGELSIIQALRMVDHNVALDNLEQMGNYLRALEVAEMIELVSRVERRLADGPASLAGAASAGAPLPHARI